VRATSPNGDADYEGRVAWSGELGYGVRPPEMDQPSKDARGGREAPPKISRKREGLAEPGDPT
jgi:NADH-quinone oxidoreductase subunit I